MTPKTLSQFARAIVVADVPAEKVSLAREAATAWRERRLSIGLRSDAERMPDRPGRPLTPQLLAPRDMPRRRSSGLKGRIALVHALAHIELNAIDLAWDLIGRFFHIKMPNSFLDDWISVGSDEARHFAFLDQRLKELGSHYGALPAHDGLWQAAQETGHDLRARVAIIPLVLEARGLDVTPPMIEKMTKAEDFETARLLEIIYNDEKKHVAYGAKWFRYLCAKSNLEPEPEFHLLVRRHFRGKIKPPFNDKARSQAGLTPGFYKPLVAISAH